MNLPDLCPQCLTELPDGYPYDHVAIDRALNGQASLFRRMSTSEQAEVVRTGRTRRIGYTDMARLFMQPADRLRQLVGDTGPHRADFDAKVRALYNQVLPDGTIAVQLGVSYEKVRRSRQRQGLPAQFGGRGRRITTTAGAA